MMNGTEVHTATINGRRRPKHYTRDEEALLRRMHRDGKDPEQIAEALSATRPGFTSKDVHKWKSRRGLTHGRVRGRRAAATTPRAEPQQRGHEITMRAPSMEPVKFVVTKSTAKAVLELLVGV